MFTPTVEVTSSDDKLQAMRQILKDLQDIDVLVGITQEKATRPGEPITNAEFCFVHTHGSPLKGIPARPIIEPAIEDDKETISQLLGEAAKAALDGNIDEANNKLNAAGLEGQGASQDWFTSAKNGWAPNAPSVMAAKIAKGSTDPKPLIDTGELRKAITYVIRKR